LEFFEGFEEAAFDTGFVALELFEDLRAGEVVEEDLGKDGADGFRRRWIPALRFHEGRHLAGKTLGGRIRGRGDIRGGIVGGGADEVVEDVRFIILGPLEPPGEVDDAVGQEGFDVAGGGKTGGHAGAEAGIGVGVFGGQDGAGGGQAVGDGVGGNSGLALRGFGAGGFLGVETVGGELFFCWHGLLLS